MNARYNFSKLSDRELVDIAYGNSTDHGIAISVEFIRRRISSLKTILRFSAQSKEDVGCQLAAITAMETLADDIEKAAKL